ncbi:MAG: MerR family transcriptional regulator [Deltaproteobacteria bacterium]
MSLSSRQIAEIERVNADGLSSQQILEVFRGAGAKLSEATLRKYVQLGLLPRSRRVGQKGKHRGSRGIYPVEVVRRVDEIRRAMKDGATLEDLAKAAQATRAKLSHARVSLEEAVDAAEQDLGARELDRTSRSKLKSQLKKLEKDAKDWLKALDRLTTEIQAAEAKTAQKKAAPKASAKAATAKKAPAKKPRAKKKASKTKRRGAR